MHCAPHSRPRRSRLTRTERARCQPSRPRCRCRASRRPARELATPAAYPNACHPEACVRGTARAHCVRAVSLFSGFRHNRSHREGWRERPYEPPATTEPRLRTRRGKVPIPSDHGPKDVMRKRFGLRLTATRAEANFISRGFGLCPPQRFSARNVKPSTRLRLGTYVKTALVRSRSPTTSRG